MPKWFDKVKEKFDRFVEVHRKLDLILSNQARQLANQEKIMAKVNELAGTLTGIRDQLTKAHSELVGRIDTLQTSIARLEEQLANQDLPADAAATLAEVKANAQAIDDIVPDAPPPAE